MLVHQALRAAQAAAQGLLRLTQMTLPAPKAVLVNLPLGLNSMELIQATALCHLQVRVTSLQVVVQQGAHNQVEVVAAVGSIVLVLQLLVKQTQAAAAQVASH
jgi:hypothetical protein